MKLFGVLLGQRLSLGTAWCQSRRAQEGALPSSSLLCLATNTAADKQLFSPLICFLVSPWWGGTSTSCLLGDCTNTSGEVFADGEQQAACSQWQLEVARVEGKKKMLCALVHLVSSATASPCVLKSHCDGQKSPYQFRISFYLSPFHHMGWLL